MNSTLESLARPNDPRAPSRRSPAWLLPLAIAFGFLLIFLALFRDRLLPARDVDVAIVLTTPGGAEAPAAVRTQAAPSASGPMLFQASGWIEPDPLPTKATALIDGVVDSVNVLEGQTVKKGDLLATLVADDARLALRAAEQNHRMAVSSHASHLGIILTVRKKLASARAAIEAARTLEDEAADQFGRVERLPEGAVSRSDVVSARLRLAREQAQRSMVETGADEIAADIARLEMETQVKDDGIAAAAIEVEKARLALDRTRIAAPISGRVLRLAVAPGDKRMLSMDEADSSTVAILYDPGKLQVRVDVPLADAAGLQVGQPAKIHCSLLPERVFRGEVTVITGQADLQRNTLQAKVRILDPVDILRPEMLCRAEFLAPPVVAASSSSSAPVAGGTLSMWVPEKSISGGKVWICDPRTKRVEGRTAATTSDTREGYRRVSEGIKPGEWVVMAAQGLRDGQRVNPNLIQP
ncbi:efflux RND transporter periplasmic adaptor subunit [Luteolibacter yonseiensis]|uniref:Efflux RND transporter periplasmic adaptor subunit n=1 Tax=Luteolibacter yonseiensis TaxID=1144680 RepID=A0A934V9H9_9BACT|nr:efflux RND transporter periplasmic adaptor subunit [Luteolibacter yonseiensis]MBK1818362.1 efflux RND transporter periplasmic adaptor subunit [Luteolibacter yonseiensis]